MLIKIPLQREELAWMVGVCLTPATVSDPRCHQTKVVNLGRLLFLEPLHSILWSLIRSKLKRGLGILNTQIHDVTEDEYKLTWQTDREHGRDLFGTKIWQGRSQVSPQFVDDENERKWQRLRECHAGNGEQWKLFDQEITDTMRQADLYIYDKKRALLASADKEKSLRAECGRMLEENNKLKYLQS